MSLTPEQIDSQIMLISSLYEEAQSFDESANSTFKAMLLFLVLGIFFFPCLVIALICFVLYKFGKNRVKENMAKIASIEAIPGVMERVNEINAANP